MPISTQPAERKQSKGAECHKKQRRPRRIASAVTLNPYRLTVIRLVVKIRTTKISLLALCRVVVVLYEGFVLSM